MRSIARSRTGAGAVQRMSSFDNDSVDDNANDHNCDYSCNDHANNDSSANNDKYYCRADYHTVADVLFESDESVQCGGGYEL